MALNTVSSDRLSTNVKNTNFTSAEKQDLTDDIKPLLGSSGGGNKNKIINGAMLVAQRGTSSTSSGYQTVDRIKIQYGGTDEAPTQAQVDVASGTSPYTSGFRKALKITNGNQTSGAGSSDFIHIKYFTEARDIANSGWNYTDPNSKITLQFWVKSSVAQDFPVELISDDGTSQSFTFMTGSLSADTWTKVTKTISGNSNLTFNNDNGKGLKIIWQVFLGTDYTGSISNDAWRAQNDNTQANDMTSTWYTTNDATFEITGVQLEVGSVATDFDHRTFGQELALCQRYFQQIGATGQDGTYVVNAAYLYNLGNNIATGYTTPVMMRASPTFTQGSTGLKGWAGGTVSIINSYNFIEHVFPSTHISVSGALAADLGNDNDVALWVNETNSLVTLSAEL